jgi:hypothetical protein
MLPRIAKLDEDFKAAITAYIQRRSRRSPMLSQIAMHVIHEGRSNTISRSATETETTKMFEASAATTMSFDEIEAVDSDYVIRKANEIADQFEKQFSQHFFQTLDDVTAQTGFRHDARGQPLTNEAVMEAFSMVHINFEKSPNGDISIITSPQMADTLQKLQSEFDHNPDLKRRWNSMMEKKRDEFRTREINRNLAG